MTKILFAAVLASAFPVLAMAAGGSVGGKNDQIVVVKGSITNKADGGGIARVNLGSVVESKVGGGNSQNVVVSGSIVNVAGGRGSKSEVNIGSVTSGRD